MPVNSNELDKLLSQRANGVGRLSVHFKDGRSRISQLYQEGAAKIRMPKAAFDSLEAVLINTSGGLTGGDRLRWEVELHENAKAIITTQACERIYRSEGGEARIAMHIKAKKGTLLAWLPQETILFNGSALSRTLDIDMDEGAELLVVEATVLGRIAMGEQVERVSFTDRWRVRLGARLVHAEDFRLGPDAANELHAKAVTNGCLAIATVLLISEKAETYLDAARAIVGEWGGVSAWQVGGASKLTARLYAPDSYALRKRLTPLLALLNGKADLPKVWSI